MCKRLLRNMQLVENCIPCQIPSWHTIEQHCPYFCRSLQFNSIVTCQLNPLRVCLPPVVKNFAAIARNYQLAYCDTIIQRNSRINLPVIGNLSSSGAPLSSETAKPLLLDSFFPFDPYRLPKSKVFVQVNILSFFSCRLISVRYTST